MELKGTWLLVVREREDGDGEVVAAFQRAELEFYHDGPPMLTGVVKWLESKGESAFICEWDGDVPEVVSDVDNVHDTWIGGLRRLEWSGAVGQWSAK